jgi:hypothetical protein
MKVTHAFRLPKIAKVRRTRLKVARSARKLGSGKDIYLGPCRRTLEDEVEHELQDAHGNGVLIVSWAAAPITSTSSKGIFIMLMKHRWQPCSYVPPTVCVGADK